MVGIFMAAPTKEEVQDFIDKNISFFITPLSEEEQKNSNSFIKMQMRWSKLPIILKN